MKTKSKTLKRFATRKVGEEQAREEQGEREGEDRLTRVRKFIRSEVRSAFEAVEAERADAKPKRSAALRQALEKAGRDERTEDEVDETTRSENSRWEKAIEELARKTGGRLHAYTYPTRFQAGQRGLADVRPKSIIDRMLNGDPKPAIRAINFFRALVQGDMQELRKWQGREARALGEATVSAGGALVPEEFAADVIAKLGDLTPLANREFMRIIPMNSDLIRFPRLSTLPVAVYGTENTDPTGQTEPGWDQLELVAREAVLVVPMSMYLVDDASVELISYLTDLFAEALARLRNLKMLTGTGTQEPEGVFTNPSINSKSYLTTDTGTKLDSITDTFFGVPAAYRDGAMWITSDIGLSVLSKLKDTTFQLALTRITDEPFNRLYGKPLFTTEAIGTGTPTKALFGNWKYYAFGDRMTMQAATDRGGKYFSARQVALRVIERYDGRVAQPAAFCQLTGVT
jgi:HK97 family phage major capsid protein